MGVALKPLSSLISHLFQFLSSRVFLPRPFPELVMLSVVALVAVASLQTPAPIRGFPRSMVADQVRREQTARLVPNPDTLRALLRSYSAEPHEAGTERSRHVAEQILARWRGMGLDARIEQFDALMPRPVARTLEMTAPERYTAQLQEPTLPQHPTTSQTATQLPTFNAYSPDGDVTAELVYVNYGVPDDYRVLDSLGISVRGKIVIARYGRSWRGIKPKVAAEHGAIGCLIYSDPRDDGYFQGDVYPGGAYRNENGAQRGSVADLPLYPGDPLTPGIGAVKNARRLSIKEAATIMKIPVLPISYADALPLLRALKSGPVAPEEWRGALPITYHLGPGPATVHLHVAFNWDLAPASDVIARMPGAERPDEWGIRGNHHDAGGCGAED